MRGQWRIEKAPTILPSSPIAVPDARPTIAWLSNALAQERRHAVLLLDGEGAIVEWHAGAERMFGFRRETMLGRPFETLFVDTDRAHDEARWALDAARAEGSVEDDRWMRRADGGRVWVASVTSAWRDKAGRLRGFLHLSRDRTDLRSHMDLLQERLERTRELGKHQTAMIATLAHEMRQPLASLGAASRALRQDLAPEGKLRTLELIDRELLLLRTVVADVMESTRAAVGKARLQLSMVDVGALLRDGIECCQPALDARSQRAEVDAAEDLVAELDALRMRQVVVNLLGNASKFSPKGAALSLRACAEGDALVFACRDPGRGVTKELLPRLFQTFRQDAADGGGVDHGLGLGLSVVKSIVEMHRGHVAIASDGPGLGTEVTVRIPLRQA